MGINLIDGYAELNEHRGHEIAIVGYGDMMWPHNVAIECETCAEVLIDFNHPDSGDPPTSRHIAERKESP